MAKQKHTTAGIRWWSPTQLLICRFEACVWQSGRDAQFSSVYGRMWQSIHYLVIYPTLQWRWRECPIHYRFRATISHQSKRNNTSYVEPRKSFCLLLSICQPARERLVSELTWPTFPFQLIGLSEA